MPSESCNVSVSPSVFVVSSIFLTTSDALTSALTASSKSFVGV
jgi:hypothetical protein